MKFQRLSRQKKAVLGTVILSIFLYMGCASIPPQLPANFGDAGKSAGSNEGEIVVQRPNVFFGSIVKMNVFVDGQIRLTLGNAEEGMVIVPNGSHTIYAEINNITKSGNVTVNVNSNRSVFMASPQQGLFSNSVVITKINETALGGTASGARRPGSNQSGVETAMNNAAEVIMGSLQRNSKIAIVNVSSADRNLSEFVAGELEYIIVNNRFTVVDRSELDRIRREQNFQLSGDVDDNTIVSIGKFAGADVVITGAITGTDATRRLRLRALNTQTAQVIAVASERF
ncbi:MAG: CsgG/HfaB family protein [Spirochaetaceae bacterium]|nr:CsgG/HfaB family protein [Spirochaetaceae bacterium]